MLNVVCILKLTFISLILTGCFGSPSNDSNSTIKSKEKLLLSVSDPSITEGNSKVVNIQLDEVASKDITISWEIQGDDPNSDFVSSSGSFVVAKGTKDINLNLTTQDDATFEGVENFNLVFSVDSDEVVISADTKSKSFSLTDDEPTPTISLASASASVSEGVGSYDITVNLDQVADFDISLNYTMAGTVVSADHGLSGSAFVFPKGQTSATFTVVVVDDYITEANENLLIELTTASGNGNNITVDAANKNFDLEIQANDPAQADPTAFDLAKTGSTAGYSNGTTVDVSLTVAGGSKYCFSESQTSRPDSSAVACSDGQGSDNGWHTSIPATINLSSGDGLKNVYVWVASSDGVVSTGTVLDSITLDTVAPSVAITSPAAMDEVNLSNYTSYSVSGSCSENSQNVSFTATGGDTGTASCSSGSYSFNVDFSSASNGNVTVSVTHVDLAGNSSSDSRIFDRNVNLASPILALSDTSSSSSSYTNSTSITVAVSNDSGAVKWCISDSQSTQPANTNAGSCGGGNWLSSRPTSYTFSSASNENKTVYLWVAAAGDVISPNNGSDSIVLDTVAPVLANTSSAGDITISNYTSYTVTGSCDSNANQVKITAIGGPTIVQNESCTSGTFSSTFDLSSMYKTATDVDFTYEQVDLAENVASAINFSKNLAIYSVDPTSISIADSTANSGYARSTAIDTITVVDDSSATQWCISETQSTAPSSTSAGSCAGGNWLSSEPTSFTLSSGQGSKTVYLWTANGNDIISQNAVSDSITLDSIKPVLAYTGLTNGDDVTLANYKSFSVSGTCSENGVTVSVSNGSDTATPTCSSGSFTTTLDFTALVGNSTANITADSADAAGNAADQISVSVDLVMILAQPTLSISDDSPAQSDYALDQNINANISSDTDATYWCLSEGQSSKPSGISSGTCDGGDWSNSRPTAFALSATEAAKTIYLWVANNDGVMNSTAVSDTITLDMTLPINVSGFSLGSAPANTSNSPIISWTTDATDSNGILKYQARILLNSDSSEVVSWADITSGSDISGLSLSANTAYKVQLKAIDNAGNESTFVEDTWTVPNLAPDLNFAVSSYSNVDITAGSSPGSTTSLTLKNIGNGGSGTLQAAVFTGDDVYFELTNDNCTGNALAVNATCTFDIRAISDDNRKLIASLTVSDGSVSSNSVSITGTVSGFSEKAKVRDMLIGDNHSCVITEDYMIYCSGWNYHNRLGIVGYSGDQDYKVPVSLANLDSDEKFIGVDKIQEGFIAKTMDGEVVSIAYNGNDKGWTSAVSNSSALNPVDSNAYPATETAIGYTGDSDHICILTAQGNVYCSGTTTKGHLGDGNDTVSTLTYGAQVIQGDRAANEKFIKIYSRGFINCGLTDLGKLYCWGVATYRSFGNGMSGTQSSPKAVSTVNIGTKRIIDFAIGEFFGCSLTEEHRVYCWGERYRNPGGHLGSTSSGIGTYPAEIDYTNLNANSEKLISITAGDLGHCGVTNQGNIYCWGTDSNASFAISSQLGTYELPTKVDGIEKLETGEFFTKVFVNSIMCGLTNLGNLYCAGDNSNGQLGVGGFKTKTTLTKVSNKNFNTTVSIKQIVSNELSLGACTVNSKNKAYCWGKNSYGRFGTGDTTDPSDPIELDLSSLPAGEYLHKLGISDEHTCVLTNKGNIYCLGRNFHGQFGDTTTTDSYTFKKANMNAVPSGHRFINFDVGYRTTCAIASDGEVYCTGATKGHTGATSYFAKIERAYIPASEKFLKVKIGQNSACVMSASGKIYCWGQNSYGQRGDGTTTFVSEQLATPVDMSGLPNESFINFDVSNNTVCATTQIGNTYCWGYDSYGKLGNGGTHSNKSVPTLIDTQYMTTGEVFVKYSLGKLDNCAITSLGRTYCWGNNFKIRASATADSDTPSLMDFSTYTSNVEFVDVVAGDDVMYFIGVDGKAYSAGNESTEHRLGNTDGVDQSSYPDFVHSNIYQ